MAEYPFPKDVTTPFEDIYDRFFGKITDDMYMSDDPAGWTAEDTKRDIFNILMDAIPGFEFPRFPLYDYSVWSDVNPNTGESFQTGQFNCYLTSEEINILALLMVKAWLQRQIASIEQTRMKYSGSDFKMTSQANHLAKLLDLKKEAERESLHMQRLYKRRKLTDAKGSTKSNWSTLAEISALDGQVRY